MAGREMGLCVCDCDLCSFTIFSLFFLNYPIFRLISRYADNAQTRLIRSEIPARDSTSGRLIGRKIGYQKEIIVIKCLNAYRNYIIFNVSIREKEKERERGVIS